MAEFVLVHGSGQHAGCWRRLARRLTASGHAVATPQLSPSDSEATLGDHAQVIADAVRGPDTVVVAHSFSGAFAPLVPGRGPRGRVAHLVFLAAIVPEPGRSVRDQLAADPAMFNPDWLAAGRRWMEPGGAEALARAFLFHDMAPDDREATLDTIGTMDTQWVVTEPCPLTDWTDVPCTVIVAGNDLTLNPAWCRQAARRIGVEPIEIDSGHCPHNSRPDELAAILERVLTEGATT